MSGIGRVGPGNVGSVPEPEPDVATTTTDTTPASTPTASPAATTRTSGPGAADIWATITKGPGSRPTPPGVNLDASGARRPVALDRNGRFTAVPGRDATTPGAKGDGLYAAAALIDDSKSNLFEAIRMPAGERAKTLANLKADLATVKAGQRSPAGLSDLQALQMRSSGATVLLELMTAKGTPDAQKREAFGLYRDMLEAETNPTLKDSMALHLVRTRASLPADLKPQIDAVRDVAAPTKPPYDAWFKNGKSTVNVAWSAGTESYRDDIYKLEKEGFTVKSESYDAAVLEKTYTVNGKKTTFNVTLRPFRSDMFNEMNDSGKDMVIYTGHSNWGRNVRDSIGAFPSQPAADGKDKLVLTDLCVGKGEMQMFKDKFPKSDLITTFTSSYFIESGDGEEPESEGIHAIVNTFKGIAARKGYEAIAEDVRRDNPWGYDHAAEGIDNNFIFPSDIATRRKALDADHDGQADVFDRLVDFSTFNVAEDTAREFKPVEQQRKAAEMVGTKNHFAAMTVNRLTIYSEVFGTKNSTSKVVPGGMFDPKPGETDIFRFTKTKIDGKNAITMQMSARFAHMSEEALRMAACFEYNRWMAANDSRGLKLEGQADVNLSGMILASHSLDTDSGYRDDAVWQEFLRAYKLPAIPRAEVERVKEIDHDWYSGSYRSIAELKRGLDPRTLAALSATGAGKIG